MAQFPAFPLWTDAYLADTGHLTTIEHGAYMLLLMTMWRAGGSLPNDDKQLARYARMTGPQWARIKPTMMPFFQISSDRITQGRLTDELGIVRQKSERQSNSARAKWRKENNKRHASAYAENANRDMPNACQTDAPISTPTKEEDKSSSVLSETGSDEAAKPKKRETYPEAFEEFWSSYPTHSNMSKKEAYDAWKRLDETDRQKCAQAVAGYRAFLKSKPDLETIHACRFISKRRFDGYTTAPAAMVDVETWAKRLRYGRRQHKWSIAEWGPLPGAEGCRIPPAMLEPGDGEGWTEQERAA